MGGSIDKTKEHTIGLDADEVHAVHIDPQAESKLIRKQDLRVGDLEYRLSLISLVNVRPVSRISLSLRDNYSRSLNTYYENALR